MHDQQAAPLEVFTSKQEMPFVSIIIPVYNDTENLKICLAALSQQTYPAMCYEIIVVDNNSQPPVTYALMLDSPTKIVYETKPGPDPARNAGLTHAKGEYLAFIDSDCIPYPDWLEQGVMELRLHPDCGLVGGRVDVVPHDPEAQTLVELFERVYAFQIELSINKYHYMPTCNLFTFRAIFDRVGYFTEELHLPGDEEWGHRVYQQGYDLIYADTVAIRHPARRTVVSMNKKIRRTAYRYVGELAETGRHPIWLQFRFLRRLFIPPTPYELRRLVNSKLGTLQKFKVLVVLIYFRAVRAYYMVRALTSRRGERLW